MKNTLFVLSVLFYAAISSAQDSWILVFHKNVTEERRNAHLGRVMTQVFANYTIGKDFRGYAAHFKKEEVARALATGDIDYAEPDQMMHASQSCYNQNGATWGLNRISEKQIELDGSYIYSRDGSGVQAFIIDTGILITHNEFAGRAVFGANYVGDGNNNDCNGHGTHVAGTVGGTTYGVAKKVTLIAVKVLGCSGSGTNSGVISGVTYAANNSNKKPSVANMSLGGGYSKALNDAVAGAVKAGVVFVVAAGNDNADACNYSPASEPTAISVGSSDVADKGNPDVQEDIRSSFSNYGTCVSVFAPGSLITSAWYTSNSATRTISGTSMASPHVAGVAALYLGENPNETPANIEKFILNDATQNVIDLDCSSTACNRSPNLLAYSACS